jgi:hypothetical protein
MIAFKWKGIITQRVYRYKSASFEKKTVALSGQVVVLLGIVRGLGVILI